MNISQNYPLLDQNQNFSIAKPKLTTLPNVLWAFAASFLELNDLKNLSLTNRIFMEALSTFSNEFKSILLECIKSSNIEPYKEKKQQSSLFAKTSTFSLAVLLQLKVLKSITTSMVRNYQKTISGTMQPLVKDVFSRCESLTSITYNSEDNAVLDALDNEVCPKLNKRLLEINIQNYCIINWWKIDSIVENCPNLTSLSSDFFYNDFLFKLPSLSNLTCLKITHLCHHLNCENLIPLISSREMLELKLIECPLSQKFIDVLSLNARKLKYLSLAQESLDNFYFAELFYNLKSIQKLNLRTCNITEQDLNILVINAKDLLYLDITDNPKISQNKIENIKPFINFWIVSSFEDYYRNPAI